MSGDGGGALPLSLTQALWGPFGRIPVGFE